MSFRLRSEDIEISPYYFCDRTGNNWASSSHCSSVRSVGYDSSIALILLSWFFLLTDYGMRLSFFSYAIAGLLRHPLMLDGIVGLVETFIE